MKLPEDCALFLKKAEEDETLLRSIQKNMQVSDSIFGFHAQQAVEKLLKAVLVYEGILFPKTHDLSMLLDLLLGASISLPFSEDTLQWLTPYATTLRYDDFVEEPLDRDLTLQLIESLRHWVANRLKTSRAPTKS